MTSNIDTIRAELPSFYDKYNNKSVLHTVISAFANNSDNRANLIKRMDDMIGIDTTHDEDLQYRWGNMLSINKRSDESYVAYRNRLKMAYPSLVGGTANAIIYAIASVIGVSSDQSMISNYIKVYDAWEYDGPIEIDPSIRNYCHILCIIDLTIGQSAIDMEQQIYDAINIVKASGVMPHIMYTGIKLVTYNDMTRFKYSSLMSLSYGELGQLN